MWSDPECVLALFFCSFVSDYQIVASLVNYVTSKAKAMLFVRKYPLLLLFFPHFIINYCNLILSFFILLLVLTKK